MKVKLKYLKVFEDFIEQEEDLIKINYDEELPIEALEDDDNQDDEELDQEDLLNEVQQFYKKNYNR